MSYSDSGSSQRLPPVVKNIIIINVIMVLAQFALYNTAAHIDLDKYLALHYWSSPDFRWWQLLTHMFMHGSPDNIGLTFEHIFFNMFGLWMFGGLLENIWGAKRFLIFYLVCGLGAGFCHMGILTYEFTSFHNAFVAYQQHPTFVEFAHFVRQQNFPIRPEFLSEWGKHQDCSDCAAITIRTINDYYRSMIDVSMVGASGAIFGVLFAFAYLFPNTELYIMFIPIPVKAKWAVTGYAVIELFSGIGHIKGDNVAHFAHLGGMLFAFILLSIWQKNKRKEFY
jgi:membrane associated rhomboid family serine protease